MALSMRFTLAVLTIVARSTRVTTFSPEVAFAHTGSNEGIFKACISFCSSNITITGWEEEEEFSVTFMLNYLSHDFQSMTEESNYQITSNPIKHRTIWLT